MEACSDLGKDLFPVLSIAASAEIQTLLWDWYWRTEGGRKGQVWIYSKAVICQELLSNGSLISYLEDVPYWKKEKSIWQLLYSCAFPSVYGASCKSSSGTSLACASAKYFILLWLPFDQLSSFISLPKQVQREDLWKTSLLGTNINVSPKNKTRSQKKR